MIKKHLSQKGAIHTLPLFLIVAVVGIISFLLISSTAPLEGLFGTLNPKPKSHAATVTFTPDSSPCGITGLAFCDNFNEGSSLVKGRAGDLDPTKWTAGRMAPQDTGPADAYAAVKAEAPPCKTSLPVSSVYPDQDALICDPIATSSATLLTPIAFQNYGIASYMVKEPFDFTGRTGKIYFDVDPNSDLSGLVWPSIDITADPIPAPNSLHFGEHAQIPENGIEIHLDTNCFSNGTLVGIGQILTYNSMVETSIPINSGGNCFAVSPAKMNHFEVDLSQNHIDVYASDNSLDNGKTFPNFHLLESDNISLNFTKGFVHYAIHNHATYKYKGINDWYLHWDNLGFDGPTAITPRQYEIPDSLVQPSTSLDTTYCTGCGPALSIGYQLRDSSGPAGEGTYTDTNGLSSKIAPFVINNVDLTGATSAEITLNSYYCSGCGPTNFSLWDLKYRLNGGAWKDRLLTPEELFVLTDCSIPNECGLGNLDQILNVPLTDLKNGTNTLEFSTANTPQNYPPIVANINLVINTNQASTSPSPTSSPSCTKGSLGDIDCNGLINLFDYNTLIGNFGKSVPAHTQGDLDGDGIINIFDYNILIGNFGK